ncbi:MAG: hypothetical protein KOO60_01865 [Gemmatimonadales bacterium]|nr:hypothetical protein [Gemmatimonadales bacterium]
MSSNQATDALVDLGLTQVEAEVYVFLCNHPPATGYAIAAAINRTKGAIYSVLESLTEKGAVEAEEGRSKLFRATPPSEFMGQLSVQFSNARKQALNSIRSLGPAPPDTRIYNLTTPLQVFERCRTMLSQCETLAVVDAFPVPLARLKPDLEAASVRGMSIWAQTYEPGVDIPGAKIAVSPIRQELLEQLSHQWITLCVDGREHLIAVMDQSGEHVHYACWSSNLLLSWVLFSYLKPHILGTRVQAMIEAGCPTKDLRREQETWLEHMPEFTSPGLGDVQDLFENWDPSGSTDS